MPISKIKSSSITADAASTNLNIDANTLFLDATNNRVGVGTTTPAQKLEVSGSDSLLMSKVTNTNTAGQSASQLVTNTAALYSAAFGSTAGGTTWAGLTGNSQTVIEAQFSSSLVIGAFNNSAPIIFAQGRAEVVRIDTAGNVGLGITPSAWYAQRKALQVSANVALSGSNAYYPYVGVLSNNVYYDSADTPRYLNSSGATAFEFNAHANGNFAWQIAQSGTAGNAISFTQAMTLTSGGALGIGTSSPAASLDVATSSGSAGQVNTHIMLSRGTSTGAFLQTERAAASNNVSALILGVNSAERMRVTDAGFVGINNNAPALALDVTGQIRGTTVLVSNAGTPTTPTNTTPTFFSPSSGVLGLVNNGSESFRVASNGNVGIGTSTPAHRLSLEGGVTSYTYFLATLIGPTHLSGSAIGIGFKPEPGSNTRVKGGLVYEGNGEGYDFGDFHFLQRRTTDSQAADLNNKVMTITSHGNVGIGTSAPDNNGGYKALTISSTTGAQIYLKSTNSSVTAYVGADSNGGYLATFTTHTLRFRTNNVDRMTINSDGAVSITGSLSKGSGSFRIEHPLPEKSETHELVHSFIEGPQADLIYRGKVNLVAGTATVNIDTASDMTQGTFEVLCRDVQCFTTNESDWTAVRGSVTGNILTIEAQDNTSTASISWMVIGERKDKHMYDTAWTDDDGKVIVEPLKVQPVETE
jgi:hypothetical protein